MEIKTLALNDIHVNLGANMTAFAGYNMPVRYSSDIEEHMTVRQGVGVFDVSHMGEFFVKGKNAINLIQHVTSNDAARLTPGRAQYSCLPNYEGGIVDDLIVYMLSEEEYMLVVNASNIDKDWQWLNQHNDFGADLTNASNDYSLFAVQGPKAIEVLQKITGVDLGSIKYYHFAIGEIGGVRDVIISATGYTGSGGFELYVKNEHAIDLWNSVFTAGEQENIKPIGLGARDTLRLEMGFCLYGNDIDDTTSPLEAGLGWITKFSKEFINSESLLQQKTDGVKIKLVAFEMIDRGIPRHGYDLEDANGAIIGRVTSGTQSPMLGKGIGMGYVNVDNAAPGTVLFIAIRKRKLKAQIRKLPFVDV
jgi:aminomethyltransferase